MLLNWQGRHFMEINHSRITSYEIADYMIRTKSLLSAKELAAILEKEYPHLDVDKRDVYLRLKAIAVSKYSSVLIDDSTRPRRFQIHSLNPEFFRRSRAPRRFDEKLQNELYMTQDEKERREHRTLRDRLERDTLDDDGERFEFEAGDYLIDNVEARKAARAMLRRSGADVLETTLLEKSLSHLLMLENARDTCIRLVQEMRDQQKDDDEGTPPEYRIASMLNSCSAQISSLINTIYSIRNNYRKESREAEKHALSMGQAGIVKLAYERKRENNWSVLEAAEFIEAHGGKVPPLMLEQIKADLRAPKTNTDDEERQTAVGGPSLEDLDKVARERAANRRADAALWIEQRREEIADIVDTGGYGDVDTEGVSNDPWLEQDLDEDEEEDEEVTRKLYGDDD